MPLPPRVWFAVGLALRLLAMALAGCAPQPTAPAGTLITAVQAEEFDAAPPEARRYRDELIRNGRAVWGMQAPIALFGGQVEQESGWRTDARSPYAGGLAQFTPATAEWIGTAYAELADPQPYNPAWALRALVRYDKHLFDRVDAAASECDRHAFALVGYNGGEGWRIRDQKKAALAGLDPVRYWGNVETVNAGRRADAWTENRGYVPAILKRQPKYRTWGASACST